MRADLSKNGGSSEKRPQSLDGMGRAPGREASGRRTAQRVGRMMSLGAERGCPWQQEKKGQDTGKHLQDKEILSY